MTTKQQTDPRAKKLDSIMRRIAMFGVQEVYTDEPDVQRALAEAIGALERAQSQLKGDAQ